MRACAPTSLLPLLPDAENARDPFHISTHLRRGSSSSSMSGSSRSSSTSSTSSGSDGSSSSDGSKPRQQLSRAEQRELLAELLASKAVQSKIPYW